MTKPPDDSTEDSQAVPAAALSVLPGGHHQGEQNFRAFFEGIRDLAVVAARNGDLILTNSALRTRLGYSSSELACMRVIDLHPPDRHAEAAEIVASMLRGERDTCPLPLQAKDGTLIPVETRAWLGKWNGQDCIFGLCKDLGESVECQQRFERLFRNNPALMAITSIPENKFIDVNDSFLHVLGLRRDEVIGRCCPDLDLFTEPEKHNAANESAMATGRYADVELQVRCRDGSLRDGLFSGEVIQNQGRQFFLTVMQDITERKHAIRKLEESERRLRQLGDNLPSGLIYQLSGGPDGQRRFDHISGGVERLHGITVEEAMRHSGILYSQIVEEDRRRMAEMEADCQETLRPFDIEVRIRRPDGQLRWIHLLSAPSRVNGGNMTWDGLELDITERKLMEDQLRQAQKMESIGQLAGSMAHEFNNILGALMLNLDLARMGRTTREIGEHIDSMNGLCAKAADLVSQLLAFGRRSVVRPQSLDLAGVITQQAAVLERLLGRQIRIEVTGLRTLPPVQADRALMEQVFLNLCLNARDAMPNGGVLRFDLSENKSPQRPPTGPVSVSAPTYVCIAISDTGRGMDEATMRRAFEPFFSTKPVGHGTGLGLATVRGILQQHHGWVEVESRPGAGSTFRIFLPATTSGNATPARLLRPDSPERKRVILLVEDEGSLRQPTCYFLRRSGYEVIEAADGVEGLALWEKHRDRIDLLFTDMIMPGGINGLDLAKAALEQKPTVRVIVTSGYHTGSVDPAKAGDSPIISLPKPYPLASLTAMLKICLPDSEPVE